jgi:hypothetical protein
VKDTATFRRTAVAVSLVAAPVLVILSIALQPPFTQGYADRLADLDRAGAAAWLSNTAFIVLQVPMVVAFLGIAHLLRRQSPRLSNIGGSLGVLATFGEAVMGGVAMVWLTMASDATHRETFAGVWERLESSPVMMFGLVGFLGTTLTIILLSIGLFRSRIVPRWVPALLGAFLALEFVGSNVSEFSSYAGGLCLLIAFGALAAHVWGTPRGAWDVPVENTPALAPSAPHTSPR